MKAIICCDCPGVPLSARATYRVVFREKTPLLWKGNRISVLMELVPQSSPIYEHLKALSKQPGKFAYVLGWDMDGSIKSKYNLLTRKEIK